jgi:phosphoribosylformimino-5-aminoimidazole carboxamide ribotide isomerase
LQVIPVIDLKNGQVVHAKHGQRGQYQPIQSQLCSGSEPTSVLAALLKLYPFQTLYIADLDAILGAGQDLNQHNALIARIRKLYPQLNIWLDNGAYHLNEKSTNITPVLGSESIHHLPDYLNLSAQKHILSLDYNATGAMGIAPLHDSAEHWPADVICMTLNAVGRGQGADLHRLNQIKNLNQSRKKPANIYAAGGVRDIADIGQLAQMGVAGVLVATALHNGKLSAQQLISLQQ